MRCALTKGIAKIKGEIKMIKKNIKLISILAASAMLLTLIICLYACSGSKNDYPEEPSEEPTEKSVDNEDASVHTTPIYQSPSKEEDTSEKETRTEEITTEKSTEKALEYISNGNGTCTVTGIGSVSDTCVIIPEKSPSGEVVTGIGDKAFYGNTKINAIQIPSTVTHIGNMSFGGCTSLIYISVSSENKSFIDSNGILYSRDMEKLIHYPALKGNDTLVLPNSLTTICDMAFYDCNSLKYIDFKGTMKEWASIKIGDYNYGLFSISVCCVDSKK